MSTSQREREHEHEHEHESAAEVGRVFDVSRACVDDGPGLRTVVFFKGCRLCCPWCHNPEGRSFEQQLARDAEGASRVVGRDVTAAALAEEVAVDMDFFAGTGGGVSFSGGEPMAQPAFALACAAALGAQGVHLALETSGQWPADLADDVGRAFDLVLLDLKHVDPEKLRRRCGGDAGLALENLRLLLESPARVQLRLTLVPGFNNSRQDLCRIAEVVRKQRPAPPVSLLPFHRLARAKERLLGHVYPCAHLEPTSPGELAAARDLLAAERVEVLP